MTTGCRQCRKFGTKLFLKGSRCLGPKCSLTRRTYAPGSHGNQKRQPRKSEYGIQLQAKQQAKSEFGLRERQFKRYFENASKSKTATGEKILEQLETRIDNVIYRLGWAVSRAQSRQLVLHGNIKINNKKINIPSLQVKPKDIIEPKNKQKIEVNKVIIPNWLKFDRKNFQAEIIKTPQRKDMDTTIDEQLIVEFYSK
jgi:small subunit ribosomal protein S4